MKIDIVITWVDGNDERLAAERRKYAHHDELKHDDVGGTTRYGSIKEIFWCLASINRFAPWVNRIYIVTDRQDPDVTPFLTDNFPEGHIPVELVDHRQIFAGYEAFLPTFSSRAIETMLWRIPGLSEHFIEMNDDFLFCAPVSPDDFFRPDGTPICYATRALVALTRITRRMKHRDDGTQRVTFKGGMIAAADILGERWTYLKMVHTPRALLRSTFEKILGGHSEVMERNIRHRFRHIEQFNPEELHYLALRRERRLHVKNPSNTLFYLAPKGKLPYVQRKLQRLRNGNYKFCCFNNLTHGTPAEIAEIKAWIAQTLSVALPA